MRRFLVVVALLILVALGWFVFFGPTRDVADVSGAGASASGSEEQLEAVKAKKAKERVREQLPRAENVSDFLAAFPQIGQDRPQDPKLAAITGRVLAGVERPVEEAVVETSRGTEPSARVRTKSDGTFLLKNAPVGRGVSLTARAAGYAPGGFDGLLLVAGQTLDVGVVYLGGALDPDATNRVEVRVVKAAGGAPVAGATVTATSTLAGALVALGAWEKQPGGTVVRVKTDDKGAAVFEKLPPNFYDFFSEAEGLTFVAKQRVVVQRDTKDAFQLEVSPALTISGVVQDEEGKPIDGVRIGALNFGGNFTMHPVTTSNDDGTFTIGGLPVGSFWIFAVKQGRGQKDVQNVESGRKDLVIAIPQGGAMALRVIDAATAKPVTDYVARPFKNTPFAYLYSPGVAVKADDGVWRQQLDKGQWGVEVTAKGYAMRAVSTVQLDAKEPVEVKLEKGAVLHGRVVSKSGGAVVRGARVFVKRGGFPPSAEKDQQTVTDDAGEFVLENLAHASTKITIGHVDHTEQSFDAQPAARGEGGALPPAVEFALPDGGRVVGHAFGPGHASIAGQSVTLMKGFDFTAMRNATIASDGAYEFTHVPPDKYGLSAAGGQRGEAEVTEGAVTTVDFGADTGGQKVAVRVMRGDAPVADTNVRMDGGGKVVRATSDAAGRATFDAVQPGAYTVSPAGVASSVSADVVVKADEAPAEVVLQMPVVGSIEVRIVDDSTGKPLNGAWANFEKTADASGGKPLRAVRGGGGNPTADDGLVIFDNLEAGRYSLRVWRDPYGSEVLEDVALGEGEAKTGVEMRLSGAGMLAGTVRNSAEKAIEGAVIHVKDTKGRNVFLINFANTSADGTYTQGQMKPGEYEVTVEKDGFAPATQHVVITLGKETRLDFSLQMGGWIDVVALKADGETPAAGAAVTLYDAAGRRVENGLTLQNVFSSSIRTDPHGKITLKGVAAGQYRVDVSLDAATTVSATADVHEGAGTPVEIRAPR